MGAHRAKDRRPSVLFVCGRNSARSQMAEGFLNHLAAGRVEVASAGVESGHVHPLAIEAMSEAGIDISSHTSKSVEDLVGRSFDVVITLCDPAREYCLRVPLEKDDPCSPDEPAGRSPVFTGVPVLLHWTVDDPVRKGSDGKQALGIFRSARDAIGERVGNLVEQGYLAGLIAQRERWESLVDGLDDGVIAHDNSRRIFIFNRAAELIMGIGREEVIGRDCHALFPPDGLCGSHCSFCAPGCGQEPIGGRLEYEMDVTTRDGTDRRVKMSVSPLELEPGKPWGVIARINDVTEVSELRQRLAGETGFGGMVGISRAMRAIFETIRQISTSDYPVLVTGESGTGKELVASAIHTTSRRAAGPFVPINCGALPDNILESELFGHVRGAFTGAIRDKKGRFELSDRGTIFLDEVGELSPSFQVKLLRVLQEGSFERVGGERSISVDVRVISATNRDLLRMVKEGKFREDLYYRLCVVPLEIPPLRERQDDIPLLVEHTMEMIRGETDASARTVSDEAMRLLAAHSWPGNVRELINALQYASVQCTSGEILAQHLPLEIRKGSGRPLEPRRMEPAPAGRRGRKRKLDRASVDRALAEAGGNKARAARILGVGRATLYRFLARG